MLSSPERRSCGHSTTATVANYPAAMVLVWLFATLPRWGQLDFMRPAPALAIRVIEQERA
jgi:hypothetical protein